MPPLTSSPPLLSRLYLSVLCNKIIKEDSALHCGRQRSPQTLETRIPRQPVHLHTQAESGAYLRDSSRVPRRRPFMKPPYAIGSVPSLSGHANAYRWRSLPRARRHRASKPQGSSERVLPWQVTLDQLICASLSHTHSLYEVGMLKVPGVLELVWLFFIQFLSCFAL